MTIPTRGVSARLTSLAAAGTFTSYPNLDIVSLMLYWAAHETADGTYSSSLEGQLASAIAFMLAHDKASILRTMGGADAPLGRPGTTQASWLPAAGVDRIRVLDNDITTYTRELYIPDIVDGASRSAYIGKLEEEAGRIATKVAAHGGTILAVTVPGLENGAEMSGGKGSGGDTVYSGAATLGIGIGTGSVPTLTLSGSFSTYPTGEAILLIGSEVFHQLSRSGATVTLGRRAHSGTSAAAHLGGATVRYGSAKVTTGVTFEGYGPAPVDHRRLNDRQYLLAGDDAAWRAASVAYWTDATLAMADALPDEVGVSVAGGQLFADGLDGAHDVLDAVGPVLGERFWAATTNLTDGRSYPSTHPNEHGWLLEAKAMGAQIIAQTEAIARLPEPPAAGALQEFVDTGQFAVEAYMPNLRIFETGIARFRNTTTQATVDSGAWEGRTTTERGYLIDVAA